MCPRVLNRAGSVTSDIALGAAAKGLGRRQGDGFRVCWTTLRAQEHGDPIRTEWRFVFESGSARNTWQATETVNALTTRRGVWANLRGRTLTIFGIITNEDGYSNLHIYDRTLEEFGMRLDFLRTDRGQVLRSLSGRLRRNEDPVAPTQYPANPIEPVETATPAPAETFCGGA